MAGIQNAAEEFLKYARLQKERKERAERAFGSAGEKILSAAKAAGTGKTGVGQKVSRVGGAKSAGQTLSLIHIFAKILGCRGYAANEPRWVRTTPGAFC